MAFGANRGRFMADINVTPLVDVMLVLLIIFMVTAPMMMQGMDVALPQTTSAPLSAEKEHLTVTVNQDQRVYINDYEVSVDALEEKMKKIMEGRPDQKVYLRADKTVPYGLVASVISEVKNAGIEKLGIVTEPMEEKEKKGR
jgi:biopolymer transport protein TolR